DFGPLKKFLPRTLTALERNKLRLQLGPLVAEWKRKRGDSPTIFVYHDDGGDCADYAREIADFLRTLEFTVREQSSYSQVIGHDYRSGLWIRWSSAHYAKHGWLPVGEVLKAGVE